MKNLRLGELIYLPNVTQQVNLLTLEAHVFPTASWGQFLLFLSKDIIYIYYPLSKVITALFQLSSLTHAIKSEE